MLLPAAWLLVLGGMATLLVAANRPQAAPRCSGVKVHVEGSEGSVFVEERAVLRRLNEAIAGTMKGRPLPDFPLARLEGALEENPWIAEANLYFDSRNTLHVQVQEREPIARVFTLAGSSFYLDSGGTRMPLLDGVSARLPVVTGFTAARRLDRRDSTQLRAVTRLAAHIHRHPRWNGLIGSIDLTPGGAFELVPVVGQHVVRIGGAEQIEEKLARLDLFYRQVMSRVPADRYKAVDVQFEGQVVAQLRDTTERANN